MKTWYWITILVAVANFVLIIIEGGSRLDSLGWLLAAYFMWLYWRRDGRI